MSSDSTRKGVREYFGLTELGDTPVDQKLTDIKRRKTIRRIYTLVGVVVAGALFYASLVVIGFSITELINQIPQFLEALTEYFPPTTYYGIPFIDVMQYWEFMVAENLFAASATTMAIAFAGTVLGLPAALFFGVMASERVVPYPFNFAFRGTMSFIRAIPALVWVLILIPLGGVGPFTAALAIMIDTTGYLGRLFTDELEEIGDGPIEGIESTGANKTQTISFGMLSQVFRQFIAWIAFDLEHNVRSAIGLGLIGAGGLGLELNIQRKTFHYTEMMACIILVILMAGSVELLSQRVRAYLRDEDEVEQTGFIEAFLTAPRKIIESTAGRR
ncbi:phosphonate ABC transporter, permease protein PhnE [Halarchaeum nitratireducens]|uniref:Phosphonate ABC transporter, permease protein PhnE n=1 Tax=Halarchaeum nitratireducens TaxID=489913 RepID=A0A830GCH4_9EURY|nr:MULTISPECIES: phosphonate ABC transporter, permease protein PhnE [Halarchaeum]MBP2250993.1 phosphonate transport system permease protein [Halarchaeum solikamskense]GGN21531.1 phosphonate ABC transporter, permease protein PhnE [Halarchaeum nitratireducens]